MKKKYLYFLLFFILMFSFNKNVYADIHKFAVDGFGKNFENDIVNNLCTQVSCLFYCDAALNKDSGVIPDSDYNKEFVDRCDRKPVTYFGINNPDATKDFSGIETVLSNAKVKAGGDSFLKYFVDNYCNKKTTDEFCKNHFNTDKGNSTENSEYIDCPVSNLGSHRPDCLQNSFNLKIYYSKKNNKLGIEGEVGNKSVENVNNTVTVCDNNVFHAFSLDGTNKEISKTFIEKYNNEGKCPAYAWCSTGEKNDKGRYNWYIELDNKCSKSKYGENALSQHVEENGDNAGVHLEYAEKETSYAKGIFSKNASKISTCDRLFSGGGSGSKDSKNAVDTKKNAEALKELIRNIWLAVRILVPVALLVFGVVDFGKAILAQDDSAIKKAQSTFIKRLIIAAIIFVVPSIIKVILKIGHDVWPDIISSDLSTLCGLIK